MRFEKNVLGDFYTTGECLACTAPEFEAPDLLAPIDDNNSDTYFVKQPKTREEIERACCAIEVCCVEALRYGGTDPTIIRRLGNDPMYCDNLLPGGLVPRQNWWHSSTSELVNENSDFKKPKWWQFWK